MQDDEQSVDDAVASEVEGMRSQARPGKKKSKFELFAQMPIFHDDHTNIC